MARDFCRSKDDPPASKPATLLRRGCATNHASARFIQCGKSQRGGGDFHHWPPRQRTTGDTVEPRPRRLRRLGQAPSPAQTTTHIPQSKLTRPRSVASSRRQATRSSRPSATSRAISTVVSPSVRSKYQILFTSFGEERSEASGQVAIPACRRRAPIACAESRDNPQDRRI